MNEKSFQQITDRLVELFEEEHGGCENNTCAMTACMSHGYSLWAIKLFHNCGVASDEFDRLIKKLPKAEFERRAEAERAEFVEEIPSVSCPHCNAVVYEPEESEYHCSSCAKGAYFEVVTDALMPDGVSGEDDGWVEDFKVISARPYGDGTKFNVAMKYGKEPEQLTRQIFEASVGSEMPPNSSLQHMSGKKVA
ncbi:hypothetical protein [Bdellovibrio sp. BCCA]|uniref:hypothetical protein n=1 Tax=Bdellovibrio sp. BCCA TaxID=3136281 RepID=UPI0030F3069B